MNRVILKASEGMILIDGEIYGREIGLAEGEDGSQFYEIPESEMPLFEEAEPEDYKESLLEFGVDVND